MYKITEGTAVFTNKYGQVMIVDASNMTAEDIIAEDIAWCSEGEPFIPDEDEFDED